jgi:hypothetical protein
LLALFAAMLEFSQHNCRRTTFLHHTGYEVDFARILAEAEDAKHTHHERLAKLTRAHFERHPECLSMIVGMDWDGKVFVAEPKNTAPS